MNTDQDGLYVCTAPGCTQRFHREDHLIVHRHKHEMTLKFSSIKFDNTLSDQTPTPTRFLRNCEEVGLFSDLELSQASDEEVEESKQVGEMCKNGLKAMA
ncbi:cyclic AMP-responsive element-binding protein 5 isoform X1 [Tachysurus ichikawai]